MLSREHLPSAIKYWVCSQDFCIALVIIIISSLLILLNLYLNIHLEAFFSRLLYFPFNNNNNNSNTIISGRLPAGNVLIFPQAVVGAGYRKVQVIC